MTVGIYLGNPLVIKKEGGSLFNFVSIDLADYYDVVLFSFQLIGYDKLNNIVKQDVFSLKENRLNTPLTQINPK